MSSISMQAWKAEQHELFIELQRYKDKDDQPHLIFNPKTGQKDLIHPEYIRIRNRITEGHVRTVNNIAHRYYQSALYRTLSPQEIASAGFLGLFEAIRKYDPYKNIEFLTYAYPWIRRDILEEFKENRTIYVPKRIQDLSKACKRYSEENEVSLDTALEILEVKASDKERIKEFLLHPIVSNSLIVNEDGEEYDIEVPDHVNHIIKKEDTEILYQNIDKIDKRLGNILKLRLNKFTLEDIGKKLNLTRKRIHQLERAGITAMRRRMRVAA